MTFTRRKTLMLTGAALAAPFATPALAADATIAVSLWDKGDMAMNMMGQHPQMGFRMGGQGHMHMMGVTATPATVKAGEITLRATNDSESLVHEMIVSPVPANGDALPYDETTARVKEEAAGHLGEVSELDPGQSGALTLTLKPGKYVLFCNLPDHFALGMWTILTVTA